MAPRSPDSPHVPLNLALALVLASAAPVVLLDEDLNVVVASASFCTAFQIDPGVAGGCPLARLGGGEWNVPQLTALLRATASGFAAVAGYEMDLVRDGLDTRHLTLDAKKLAYDDTAPTRLILSICDVTDLRAATKHKEDLLREKDVLLQELHHRVANSLQIIASVLMQSARNVQSEETRFHLRDAHQRVMSVAALQKQLAASRQGDVELRPYFKALCETIGASMIGDRARIGLDVNVDDSITTADTSVSLGLIVTELMINALKHAFPDNRGGKIAVSYGARGPHWKLTVGDDGIGMPSGSDTVTTGLGTSIVHALAKQLDARVEISDAKPGTLVTIAHAHVPVLVGQSEALQNRSRAN
jgi:two-component system, sensor histidine kinase PdtaS